jgi:hypothetical protein
MKKRVKTGIIVLIVVALAIAGFYAFIKFERSRRAGIGPCHGYDEVAEFDRNIKSENDAIDIIHGYLMLYDFNFTKKDLKAFKEKGDWHVEFTNLTKKGQYDSCLERVNQFCIGQEFILKEKWFGPNKILMEYQISC